MDTYERVPMSREVVDIFDETIDLAAWFFLTPSMIA